MKTIKNIFKIDIETLPSTVRLILLYLSFSLSLIPALIIIGEADRLGVFWTPVLFLYFAILITIRVRIQVKHNRAKLIYILGLEGYYRSFPGEKARDERIARRRARREEAKRAAERKDGLADY